MNWNYEEKLIEYIAQAQRDSGLGEDYIFEVCTEQIFAKLSTLTPNTIYVVVKYLSSTNTLNAVQQPIQLIISCEQNQIQASQIIFSKLVASHNFEAIIENGTYVKQDYREPVVLSNFNEVSYGYRTIMYISATLFIMENVIDVNDLTIATNDYRLIDLSETELEDLENNFTEGNYTNKTSPKYFVDYRTLREKRTSEGIINNIGLYNDGGSSSELEGRLIVNNYQCASFIISGSDCILQDTNGNTIEEFSILGEGSFTIQFMSIANDEECSFEYINEIDFTKVFPKIITKKVLGYRTVERVKPISASIIYAMTPNTQPIPPDKIATSVKSVATFALTLTVPLTNTYHFVTVASEIMAGEISGNLDFEVSFTLGSVEFNNIAMKMTSSQITTAINEVPGLQIGLIK